MECQFSVQRVKGQCHRMSKNLKIVAYLAYMFDCGRARRVNRRLQTRSDPLLDLDCCRSLRRSATGRTAAHHVGTIDADIFSCLCCSTARCTLRGIATVSRQSVRLSI